MNTIYKIIITLSLISSSCIAQQTISGIVTNMQDHPLPGVNVYLPETQMGAITNDKGEFSISLPSGNIIHIQFSFIGYKTIVKIISGTEASSPLQIRMEPGGKELEEVVITSNKSALPDNIPFPVNTFSKEERDNSGKISSMQSLSQHAGIDRISVGNGIGKPVIRGLSFNRILLYAQGTRIENQQWDDRHDLGVNENGVSHTEVVYGPSALIYGADASGGALVFVDDKPLAPAHKKGDLQLDFHSGTVGFNLNGGFTKTKSNGFFYSLRGGGVSHTSYIQGKNGLPDTVQLLGGQPFAANSKFQSGNAKLTAGWLKNWGSSKITYNFYQQLIGIIEIEPDSLLGKEAEEQRVPEVEAPMQNVGTHIFSVENIYLKNKSKVELNVAYQLNDRKEFEPLGGKKKYTRYALKLNVLTYDARYTYSMNNKASLTIGSQGMAQKNENSGLESLVPDATVSDFAGFAVFKYDMEKINFMAGIRADARKISANSYLEDTLPRPMLDFEKSYSPINGSLGIAFHPSNDFTIKLNTASGFSAPNYAELGTYGVHEGTYRFEIGNEDLKVQQNYEADLGIIWENENAGITLNGFYNVVNDYIYLNPTSDSIDGYKVYRYVQHDATLKGGELITDLHPSSMKGLDIRLQYGMVLGELKDGGDLPYIPANKFSGTIKISGDKKIWMFGKSFASVTVSDYLKQEHVAEFESPTNSYLLVDLMMGGKFKWGKHDAWLKIFANNLLDKAYFSHLSLIKSINIYEPGIDIGLSFSIEF
ncbi:MAG: TonB-dependent receptor domain-containing protein [Bacteroidia bacterium]